VRAEKDAARRPPRPPPPIHVTARGPATARQQTPHDNRAAQPPPTTRAHAAGRPRLNRCRASTSASARDEPRDRTSRCLVCSDTTRRPPPDDDRESRPRQRRACQEHCRCSASLPPIKGPARPPLTVNPPAVPRLQRQRSSRPTTGLTASARRRAHPRRRRCTANVASRQPAGPSPADYVAAQSASAAPPPPPPDDDPSLSTGKDVCATLHRCRRRARGVGARLRRNKHRPMTTRRGRWCRAKHLCRPR